MIKENTKQLPMRAVKVFESAARHMSFSSAAKEFYLSQSAVSHQIKLLEQFLGEALFIRHGKQLALTEVGQTYYQNVAKALELIYQSTDSLLMGGKTVLHIFAQSALANHWLIPLLPEFEHRFPHIELQLSTGWINDPFQKERYDVFIGTWPMNDEYEAHQLSDDTWFPVYNENLLGLETFNAQDMCKHTPVTSEGGADWLQWQEHYGVDLSKSPMKKYSHQLLSLAAVTNNGGVALSNALTAGQLLHSGPLRAAKHLSVSIPWLQYRLFIHRSRSGNANLKALSEWLLAQCQ